jgi:hypothetical protein
MQTATVPTFNFPMRIHASLSYIALAVVVTACASAGATFKSGVAPKQFDHPPFYAGATVTAGASRVAHFPIRYQRGAEQPATFEPASQPGSPAATLVAEMNAFLDSLSPGRIAPKSNEVGTPPDVRFGCVVDIIGDCTDEGEVNGTNRKLDLSVGRPSTEWITWLGAALDDASADHALLITLELAQYWPRQKGLSLAKEIELGTGYTVGIPWLTSLEKPVSVVQLTAVLVGRDGRAVRIGAEGLLAKRSPLVASALGLHSLVSDDDIAQLRTLKRENLPGHPLVWQAALRALVAQLTGQTDVATR